MTKAPAPQSGMRSKQPDVHAQLVQKGIALQRQRRFVEAEFSYQSVLRDAPRHADALNLMGTLALEANRPADALVYFQKALRELPREPNYLNNLGAGYLAAKELDKAEAAFRKALMQSPGFVDALCNLGRIEKLLNRTTTALECYEKAFALSPNLPKAMLGLADVLVDAGDMDRATALYRNVIAIDGTSELAFVGLAMAHKFSEADPEPAQMLKLIDTPAHDPRVRAALRHAVGKAQADLKNYDAAFTQFAAAKEFSAAEFNFTNWQQRHDRLVETLTPTFFADRAHFGINSDVPIFIVGMPRSGTTLTEQICASHSKVSGAGELLTLGDIAKTLGAQDADPGVFVQRLTAMTAGQSRDLAKRYLEQLRRFGGGATHITDKMPHNFEHLGLIALLFPKARIIHCQRSPLSTCVSCFTHHFSEAHGYNTDLAMLGRYYRQYVRLMAHWRAALPLAIMDNSYEALIDDQEAQSRALIAFLGLEWEDACLDFHTNDRLVKTPSRWQVRQPIYASSLNQWQKYQAHLGPLIEALGDLAR